MTITLSLGPGSKTRRGPICGFLCNPQPQGASIAEPANSTDNVLAEFLAKAADVDLDGIALDFRAEGIKRLFKLALESVVPARCARHSSRVHSRAVSSTLRAGSLVIDQAARTRPF